MMVLGLIFFILILMVSGVALDLIRHEQKRVQIQSVSDRAVLAAASMTQTRDIEEVVRDYFAREGLSRYIVAIHAEPPSLNAREVQIITRATVPAIFSRLIGLSRLESPVISRAEERIADVEVVMVLDLSNSMNRFSRIENLRIAGVDFIDTLFEGANDDRIAVSIVPYTGQVNAGHGLLGFYNTTHRQPFSACVQFDGPHYNQLDLSRTAPLTGAGHFDPWHSARFTYMAFCPTHPGGIRGALTAAAFNSHMASMGLNSADFEPLGVNTAEIMVMQDNPDLLRRRLRSLIADGNTSIEIGMKWAAALLHNSANPIVTGMIGTNLINAAFDQRPFAFDNPDAIKAVILMTDGENWDEWRMADAFKTGPSGVWHSFERPANITQVISSIQSGALGTDVFTIPGKPSPAPLGSRLSVRHPTPSSSQNNFYIPDRNVANPTTGTWSANPDRWDSGCQLFGPTQPIARRLPFTLHLCANWVIQELDHRELWAALPVRWVATNLIQRPNIQNVTTWLNQRLISSPPGPKDTRLFQLCDQLRNQNVRVYAVAFEAPPNGVYAMRRCAFNENHFFDVNGMEIQQAFRTIAGSIQQLRLTE